MKTHTAQHVLDKKGHDVWSIRPDDFVIDAIQEMADKNVGALVVLKNDKLVGIISERDYARKVILQDKSSHKTRVREIMTAKVICGRPDQTIDECMAVMTEKRMRHLPILHQKQLVGMITLGDVVKSIIEDQKFEIEELYNYIQTARTFHP